MMNFFIFFPPSAKKLWMKSGKTIISVTKYNYHKAGKGLIEKRDREFCLRVEASFCLDLFTIVCFSGVYEVATLSLWLLLYQDKSNRPRGYERGNYFI
jgi:hypothetical protein